MTGKNIDILISLMLTYKKLGVLTSNLNIVARSKELRFVKLRQA